MRPMQLPVITALILVNTFSNAANVATVNGKGITDVELSRLVANVPERQRENILKDPTSRQQLINNLIDQEVLAQEAADKKIEQTKEFKDAYEAFRKQTLVTLLVQRQMTGRVTDAMAKEHYGKNKLKYSTDQVKAFHVLSSTEAEARAVLAEVKKPNVDFQSVAEKQSKDPTAKNNRGDVGFFTRDMFDAAFSNAAFSAKSGEIVGPIKTLYGYHIIKVIDRKVGKIPEFVEVEQRVRNDVQRDLLQSYVSTLRKKAKITR
jgi:peptidyl-prolyl cis-trans isomerase C